jgi:hypothetical protein
MASYKEHSFSKNVPPVPLRTGKKKQQIHRILNLKSGVEQDVSDKWFEVQNLYLTEDEFGITSVNLRDNVGENENQTYLMVMKHAPYEYLGTVDDGSSPVARDLNQHAENTNNMLDLANAIGKDELEKILASKKIKKSTV